MKYCRMLFECSQSWPLFMVIIFLSVMSQTSATYRCGEQNLVAPRIVGGEPATNGSYPWITSLRTFIVYDNKTVRTALCAGSLINDKWILTASHCAIPSAPYPNHERIKFNVTYAVFGKIELTDEKNWEKVFRIDDSESDWKAIDKNLLKHVYRIDQIVTHPKYDAEWHNDIAVMRLNKKVTFSPLVHPICLPSIDMPLKKLTVAGWGSFNSTTKNDRVLHHTKVEVVTNRVCEEVFWLRDVDRHTQICFKAGSPGVCNGDSGAPFMLEEGKRWFAVAVVSYGKAKCEKAPRVASKVFPYRDWILEQTKDDN